MNVPCPMPPVAADTLLTVVALPANCVRSPALPVVAFIEVMSTTLTLSFII